MPDRIRVLFAIGSLAGGGSERQLVNILRHVDRAKFDPQLYLVSRSGEFLDQVPDDVQVTSFIETVSTGGLHVPGRIHRAQVTHLADQLREQKIDVLYDRTPNMTLITAPACRRANVPRLSTIVCDPQHDIQESFNRFRWIKKLLLMRAYRTADRVIANSRSLAAASRMVYGIDRKRMVAISNGFDFDELSRLSGESVADTSQQQEGVFKLVAVGRLHPQKGLFHLIDAVGELRQRPGLRKVVLSVVGQGPELGALQRRVEELGLSEQVRFTGFLPNPYSVIRSADLFCLTSLYEGMPNVLVEAMSLGVPVLSTDCPHGPREILLDGDLGVLVPTGDAKAIANGIEQVMSQDSEHKSRAIKAQESVWSRFGIATATRELEDLLSRTAR